MYIYAFLNFATQTYVIMSETQEQCCQLIKYKLFYFVNLVVKLTPNADYAM
jgi:hypothetical protein